ncbi:MAG: hypothetical protein GY913_15305 [Proteobacteria bacterium]|nr:hypothetical protein [Pseudomonadota bacterium]
MPKTYQLGDGHSFHLEPPGSYTIVREVAAAAQRNASRALAAALGLCMRGPGRVPLKYADHGYDAMAYGGAVLDALHKRKALRGPDGTWGDVANIAYALMLESVITEEEVKREAGNSPGEVTASPESSSTSSDDGASTPDGSPA